MNVNYLSAMRVLTRPTGGPAKYMKSDGTYREVSLRAGFISTKLLCFGTSDGDGLGLGNSSPTSPSTPR